jgi:hypothetical protein
VYAVDQHERVAVRRRFRHEVGSDQGAAAGPVVEDELLSPAFGELLADHPADQAGGASGSVAADETHGTVGIVLLRGCCSRERNETA